MSSIQNLFTRTHFSEKEYVFVLMPFREPFNNIYHSHIRSAVEACGMNCIRADEVYSDKTIMGDIWEGIQKADIIVAELSTRNPNVMYELGLSHALWRKTILISQSMDDVPFDLRSLRIITYDASSLDRLSFELQGALESLQIISSSDPAIRIKNDLEKDYVYCGNDLSNSEYNWKFWVDHTQKELIIFGSTIRKWLGDSEIRTYLMSLIRKKIKVSVYLSDWEPIEAFGGTGVIDLYNSAEDIKRLKEALPDQHKQYFYENFNNAVSTLSGVFSDPDEERGMMLLTPRFASQHNSETRMYIIIERRKRTALFNSVKNDIFMIKNIGNRKTSYDMIKEYELRYKS